MALPSVAIAAVTADGLLFKLLAKVVAFWASDPSLCTVSPKVVMASLTAVLAFKADRISRDTLAALSEALASPVSEAVLEAAEFAALKLLKNVAMAVVTLSAVAVEDKLTIPCDAV